MENPVQVPMRRDWTQMRDYRPEVEFAKKEWADDMEYPRGFWRRFGWYIFGAMAAFIIPFLYVWWLSDYAAWRGF